IQIPLVVSQSPAGGLIINAATGDQENIISSADENFVESIEEGRPDTSNPKGSSKVDWYLKLTDSERVTGPMVVFDRTLYFASFRPEPTASVCSSGSKAFLWGLDYMTPHSAVQNG